MLKARGQSFTLDLSLTAICELQDAAGGADIGTIAARAQDGDIPSVRLLLWALLMDNHPEIDLKAAGKLIPDGGLPELMAVMREAITRVFPTPEANAENPPIAETGTSTIS